MRTHVSQHIIFEARRCSYCSLASHGERAGRLKTDHGGETLHINLPHTAKTNSFVKLDLKIQKNSKVPEEEILPLTLLLSLVKLQETL